MNNYKIINMDPIETFLCVKDAIEIGRKLGTKIGYDHIFMTADRDGSDLFEKQEPMCNCLLVKNHEKNPENISYKQENYYGEKNYENSDIDNNIDKTGERCECGNNTYSSLILHKLQTLVQNLEGVQSYCCGGEVYSYRNDFVISVGTQTNSFLDLDVKKLENEGIPASFGDLDHMETVINPLVRTALELKFTSDMKHFNSNIIEEIKKKLNNNNDIELIPHKVNIYHKGGFFKHHVDTPISDNMLGTLVITYPSKYKGGDLIIQHGTNKNRFNYDNLKPNYLGWVAFYGNCVHEVTPVTSGLRITFTFYIMNKKNEKVEFELSKKFQNYMNHIENYIKQYRDQGNQYLGIFTQHRYTMNGVNQLKGVDELFYNYIKNLDCKQDLSKYLSTDVVKLINNYNTVVDIKIYPVLVYYHHEHFDGSDEERTASVVICTENDFNYFQNKLGSKKQEYNLPNNIPFIGKLLTGKELKSSSQSYCEYTGNEAQPYQYNGIYLSAVMVLKLFD